MKHTTFSQLSFQTREDEIACPQCGHLYFFLVNRWLENGESVRSDPQDPEDHYADVENPRMLLCVSCGACIMWYKGEWVWIRKDADPEQSN